MPGYPNSTSTISEKIEWPISNWLCIIIPQINTTVYLEYKRSIKVRNVWLGRHFPQTAINMDVFTQRSGAVKYKEISHQDKIFIRNNKNDLCGNFPFYSTFIFLYDVLMTINIWSSKIYVCLSMFWMSGGYILSCGGWTNKDVKRLTIIV